MLSVSVIYRIIFAISKCYLQDNVCCDVVVERFEYAGWEYTGMDLDEEDEDIAADNEQNEEEAEEEEEEVSGSNSFQLNSVYSLNNCLFYSDAFSLELCSHIS